MAGENDRSPDGRKPSSYSDAFFRPLDEKPSDNSYAYSPTTGSRRHHQTMPGAFTPPDKRRFLLIAGFLLMGAAVFLMICAVMLITQLHRLREETAEAEAVSQSAADVYEVYSLPDDSADYVLVLGDNDPTGAVSADVIYQAAGRYTVRITAGTGEDAFTGTGIILTEDGYILTDSAAVSSALENDLTPQVTAEDGKSYDAAVTGIDEDSGLAVLKIDADGLTPAVLSDADLLRVGQTVYTLGDPFGSNTFTMTRDIISALDRTVTTESGEALDVFQLDTTVYPGIAGGPVINEFGHVIGIITSAGSDSSFSDMGFAVPAADAVEIANEIITNGYVSGKAYLGLKVGTVDDRMAAFYDIVPGVYVYEAEDGSCALAAGIQPGDVITAVNGTRVTDKNELVDILRTFQPGDSAVITVYRNGEYIPLTVTFDEALPHDYSEDDTGADSTSDAASGEASGEASEDPSGEASGEASGETSRGPSKEVEL